jgi:hypothetical protein
MNSLDEFSEFNVYPLQEIDPSLTLMSFKDIIKRTRAHIKPVEGRGQAKRIIGRLNDFERKISQDIGEILMINMRDYEMDARVNERGRNNIRPSKLKRAEERNCILA